MNLWKTTWTMFKISSTMQTNSFISMLRKMPLFSGLFPESLYRRTHVKYLFSLGGVVKGLLGSFLGSTLLCLFLLAWLPTWLGVEPTATEMVLLYIVVKGIVPNLRACGMFKANEKDYTFLNHFMMNPAEYYHYKIGKEALEKVVTVLPVLVYLLRDAGFVALLLSTELFCTLGGCCFHLWMYDGTFAEERDSRRIRNRRIRNGISVILVAAMYLFLKLGALRKLGSVFSMCLKQVAVIASWLDFGAFPAEKAVTMSVLALLCVVFLLLSLLFYRKLLNYRDYKRIAVEFANKEAVTLVVTVNSPAGEEGVDALRKFSAEKNTQFFEKNKDLHTAEYLNKAFFTRFHQVFSSQRKQILGLGLILGLFLGYLIRMDVLHITAENALGYTPMLITLTGGIMLFGQRFTTLCFRFVDMPMLYHRLCGKEYLKKSMKVRYLFLVRHCMVALFGLCLFLAALLLVSGLSLPQKDILLVLATMGLYMLTNELYNLTVYYLIQPYTVDISVKSPVFKVLSTVESLFDISVLFLRGNLARALLPMLGLFLFVNVLFLVTAGRVEKTFRLRG